MALIKKQGEYGYFVEYILRRIRRNKNFLFAITGPTGGGKSWSGLKISEVLDKDFSIQNVCFTASEFMNLVNGKTKELKKGSVIMFDELQISLGHLDYQKLQAKMMNYVLSTFRHKNFILVVTTPYFHFINASARKLFHCRAETIGINKEAKQVKLKPLLLQTNQDTGKTYAKYLRVITPKGVRPLKVQSVGMPSKEIIEQYEHKKTVFTRELNESIAGDLQKLEGKERVIKPNITVMQENILNDLKQGMSVPEIAKKMGKNPSQIHKRIGAMRKKGIVIQVDMESRENVRYVIRDTPLITPKTTKSDPVPKQETQ